MNTLRIFILTIIWSMASLLCAQKPYHLKIIDLVTGEPLPTSYTTSFGNIQQRDVEVRKLQRSYFEKGYAAFSVDSTCGDSLNKIFYINPGIQYHFAGLSTRHINDIILSGSGFRRHSFNKGAMRFEDIRTLKKNILKHCENNGFPFAEVFLDSIFIEKGNVQATLILNKNPLILFDSIVSKGNVSIKTTFWRNYLGIKEGKPYSEDIVLQIDKRINDLTFVKGKKPAAVSFNDNTCKVLLWADKKKSSQFDGVLGILPDNITGKVVITGDIKLNLVNSFGSGETIGFNWMRIDENSQKLITGFDYPYVLGTPAGISYHLNLLRQDTSYINIKHKGSIKYMFDGFDNFSVFGESKTSALLSTFNFEYLTSLPAFADMSQNFVGMGVYIEDFDFRQNPSKGYHLSAELSGGQKNISKHPKINDTLYDGIKLKSLQYKYDFDGSLFFDLPRRHVLKLGLTSGRLFGETLFANELYLLGGTKLLRGFDESSVKASFYAVSTIEYRFIIGRLSYLSLFWDKCYYENISNKDRIIDRPYSLGTGFTFETKQGIFSISYALGKQFDNPIQFKTGKIHLGYASFF